MDNSKEQSKTKRIVNPKALLIVNDLGIFHGGTQKRVCQLVVALLDKHLFNHIFVVAHHAAKENQNQEGNKEIDATKITVCYTDKNDVEQTITEIIEKNNIIVVQVHNLSMLSTRAIKAAKKLNKKVIFFAHDYWPVCGRRSFYTKWKKPCTGTGVIKCLSCIGALSYINIKTRVKSDINKCDFGLATTDFMVKRYEENGVLVDKWKKVTPWIEEEYLSEQNKNKDAKRKGEPEKAHSQKIILYVGSLDEEKGFFDLLEAFIKVKNELITAIPLKLIAVGEISIENKERGEHIINAENAEEMVEIIGYVQEQEHLIALYKKADLFIFPSRLEESFGQTWAQALASGAPVIAYGSGSVKELLGNHGKTIKIGDKKQLKEAIKIFFKSSGANNGEKANVCQEYAQEKFSIKNAMPLLGEIYGNVVKKNDDTKKDQ